MTDMPLSEAIRIGATMAPLRPNAYVSVTTSDDEDGPLVYCVCALGAAALSTLNMTAQQLFESDTFLGNTLCNLYPILITLLKDIPGVVPANDFCECVYGFGDKKTIDQDTDLFSYIAHRFDAHGQDIEGIVAWLKERGL